MHYTIYKARKHTYAVQPTVAFRGTVLLAGDARTPARLVASHLDKTLPGWAGFRVRARPTRRPGQFRITYALFDQDNQPYTGADPLAGQL
jgi:hypothetical protein